MTESRIAFRGESVPDAGIRSYEPRTRGMYFEFLAQLSDEHPQILRLLDVCLSPHGQQQHAMGQHFSGMLDHVFEKVVLGRLSFTGCPSNVTSRRSKFTDSPPETYTGRALWAPAARRKSDRIRAKSSSVPNGLVI